ncbi:MAG TPA: RecX family transcriptional regulator [Gaiellaceae bacterium]|nr:RecX family transcriptional regulator [Gaiellaceae bacterium]
MPVVAPRVTALTPAGSRGVAVEVDGRPWRVVPSEAAAAAGLAPGLELERPVLRSLRRELRRGEALAVAVGTLRHRDHTRASLEERLAGRGVAPAVRAEALDVLDRAGVVDDQRLAHDRAALLAARGAGDLLIADDLTGRGVPEALVDAAVAALEPEDERARHAVGRLGLTPKTLRRLAAKGFRPETLEPFVAELEDGAIP